jgi:hypothetical protein
VSLDYDRMNRIFAKLVKNFAPKIDRIRAVADIALQIRRRFLPTAD